MKKITVIMGFAAILTLGSCTKAWTCQCTDNNGVQTIHNIPNSNLSDATKTCNNFEYHNGASYTNCSLQ